MIGRARGGGIVLEDDPGSAWSPIFEGSTGARARATIVAMLTSSSYNRLAETLDGSVVLPNDPRYDEARS